jgi:N-acetylmuramoyl-L-alanine amidase
MMGRRAIVVLLSALFGATTVLAQTSLLQQATAAFNSAQQADKVLNEKPKPQQTRSEVLKVISAYQRVYLITPKTSYADDALLAIARLYESIGDIADAVKTLKFLVSDYPQSPYKKSAERDIATLSAGDEAVPAIASSVAVPKDPEDLSKTVARIETKPGEKVSVDNVRYWPAEKSLRVVVDLSGEVRFKQGSAKSPDRVYIDIANAYLNPSLVSKEWTVGTGMLQKIRVGQFDAGTVRVVLDLSTMLRANSFTLKDPDRLIIDIVGDGETVTPSAVEQNTAPKRAITDTAPSIVPPPSTETGSHTPSVIAAEATAAKPTSPVHPPIADSATTVKTAVNASQTTVTTVPAGEKQPRSSTSTSVTSPPINVATASGAEKSTRTSPATSSDFSPTTIVATASTTENASHTLSSNASSAANGTTVTPGEKASRGLSSSTTATQSAAKEPSASSTTVAAAPPAEKATRASNSTSPTTPPPVKDARTAPTTAPSAQTAVASVAPVTPKAEGAAPEIKTDNKVTDTSSQMASTAQPTSLGNRTLIRSLGLKVTRVVIDAGHGGKDTGSIGPTGYSEKELVLDVAKRLKTLIETEIGAEVIMTRNDDTFVPLETRTQIANQQEADMFISIHANSSKTKTVRGVETFFLNFTTSKESLDLASRENAGSDKSVHELSDLVKRIVLTEKVTESRELAERVQTAMSRAKGTGPDRGVKQAPFMVLIGANMPSILAEISFISNPDEEKVLRTPAYRQHLAEYLLDGVRSYADTLSGVKTASSIERH